MKLSKSVLLGLSFGTIFSVTSVYAENMKMTATEINTLATVAMINKSEIIISEVATNKTHDAGVTDLAHMMITDHSASLTKIVSFDQNPRALSLALSHGTAEKLLLQSNNDLTKLGALQDDQFNHAYVDAMVAGHTAALHLIDTQLMKTAHSDEMKKFMIDTRAMVADHLEHAKALQKKNSSLSTPKTHAL